MLKPIGTIAGLGLAVASVSWLYRALRRRFVSRHRGNLGINVETSITIKESPERLYRFWRNFENLPHVMSHLDSVRVAGPTRSHWDGESPRRSPARVGCRDHQRHAERADRVALGGERRRSVRFEPTAGGACIVRVTLQYDPPGGDLASFKTSMERGALADAVSF